MNDSQRRYNASDKGKAARQRYCLTPRGREAKARADKAYRDRQRALARRLAAIHERLADHETVRQRIKRICGDWPENLLPPMEYLPDDEL